MQGLQVTELENDLEANVCTRSWKEVVRATSNDSADARAGIFTEGSRKLGTDGMSGQWRSSSAKDRLSAPTKIAVHQYRPRDSRGSRINSVAPGTKPEPRWCPTGLTHTQKRRVQRLRALEIKKEIAEEKQDEQFNRDKPMVSTKTWKEKRIMAKESRAIDDMIDDEGSENSRNISTVQGDSKASNDTIDDENSENGEGIPTDMDINMMFTLPAEFRASKA